VGRIVRGTLWVRPIGGALGPAWHSPAPLNVVTMGSVEQESELGRIDRIRRLAGAPRGSGVVLGIGDDCAIFRPRGAIEDLVFTTDLLVEDVHFRRETHRPEDVGWKALARGLSDIAAMGAAPRFCLVSLALAPWADSDWAGSDWVDGFYRGLLRLARREKTVLAGGDLGRAAKVMCDIVVCGSVPCGRALRRDGARAGDGIYVSGALGGSALGLSQLGLSRRAGKARRRHLTPEPRLGLGRFLREQVHATAAMDVSDGLSLDLHRLCLESRLSAAISAPPVFPGASLEQALHGGEDYELLFTARARSKVPGSFEGLPLTRIGTMRKGRPGAVFLDGARFLEGATFPEGAPLPLLGYDHFRKP
jgi:thiamine-monophosphate kinase